MSGDHIAKTEKAFERFKAKVDGILTPGEIRHIRKDILKLTQEEAGKIFGGGKRSGAGMCNGNWERQTFLGLSYLL